MSKLFWAMLSFITRLPVPRRWSQGLDFEHYSRGIITFPLIGLLLGAISGLVFMVLQAWCGAPLAALFSVLVLVLMTGGFHLDGLADTCDGVFSARSRDRMLEIMRDSRLGTHGGLALIFVVLAKILVLSELALRGESILASLAAACAVSRGTAALLMYRHRYAREEGLGNVFIGKIDGRQTCVTLGLAAIFAAVLLPGMHGVAAMVVTMVAIFILGPNNKKFQEAQGLLKSGGGFEINGYEDFEVLMLRFAVSRSENESAGSDSVSFLKSSGEKAGAFVASLSGATNKVMAKVNF